MAFDAAYLLLRDENARGGSQCWTYRDTVTPAAISAAAYLAIAAGMRVGDRVEYTRANSQSAPTSVTSVSQHVCTSVDSTTGYPTLSDAITSSATSDAVSIALAASATTDGMDITITVEDGLGNTIAAVHQLEVYMSEAATGAGLTADTYSGDLTATTGSIQETVTSKKHWRVQTAATGIFAATLVDSGNPADQYVVVKDPNSSGVFVSEVSGTNWEGV